METMRRRIAEELGLDPQNASVDDCVKRARVVRKLAEARHVIGHCPACGRTSLIMNDDGGAGHLVCGHLECPDPTAVDRLLDDAETEHVFTVHRDYSFTIRHPVKERLDGALEECAVHNLAVHRSTRLPEPGRYRVHLSDHYGRLSFDRMAEED
jgi:hypothetical protein